MSINNNRPFFRDFITDGWTKKDWALNLIPLGGIASVAYEIGSACLSSRDRTAKISEDFFKSPIQSTLKKIAQCLWVPIVVCGSLKLVYFIVNACWNRCFPSANNRPREESQVFDTKATAFEEQPIEVNLEIFSYLNLHELGVSRRVSKRWNQFASTPILWQSIIYREIAFSSKNWAQWDADLVKDVNMRQEMLSLPKNIAEELRRSAFPGKSIRETHVLVRMPKGLTIIKLGELANKYFPNKEQVLRKSMTSFVDKSCNESVWLLMTKDVLPESRSKSYRQQKNIVAKLAKTTRVPYQVPTTLEAMTCIFAEYSYSKTYSIRTNACCHDSFFGFVMVCAETSLGGLDFFKIVTDNEVGIVALRKF